MSDNASVCESIENGTLLKDINHFTNEQILPYLPYLWSLLTYSHDNGTLVRNTQKLPKVQSIKSFAYVQDVLRSRIVDFPISNTFKSYFSINYSSIEYELQSFSKSEQLTFDYKPFNSMDYTEKLIYVCKECIAINKIYGNVISLTPRQFEPFDQELYHDEVVCIITWACQNYPSRIQLVTLACGLLFYKHGAKLLVKLVLNQCNTIDQILQTFTELRFHADSIICHERDNVMLELFKLRPYSVKEYLDIFLDSDSQFNLAAQILCSKFIDTEIFIDVFTNILSKSDDRFIKFLVKSQAVSNVYTRIHQIAESRNQIIDHVTSQLVILITKLFLHRGFRQMSIGAKFVLEYFAYLRTKDDGYLKTLLSSFVVCFVVANSTEEKHLAEDFFQNLHQLVTKEEFSSFNEFLLLVAIQFQSLVEATESSRFKHDVRAANDEELNKLFGSTLGFKVYCGYNRYMDVAKLFLQYAIFERDIVELASKISVTQQLNSHLSGYLPVHCIDYLLNNRSFSKFKVSIEDWLQKQILECCAPVHPIIVSIIRKYATSCVSFDINISNNRKIDERFFRDLFSHNILTETNVVPYLLSFYFVLVFNSTAIQAPVRTIMHSSSKLYSSDLLSMMPLRHLISVMDEQPEMYKNLRTKLQVFTVENMFHMIPTIEDDLRKQTNEMFKSNGLPAEAISSIKEVEEIIKGLPGSIKLCEKVIQRMEKLSVVQLAEFYQPIAQLMNETLNENILPQTILLRVVGLFQNIETMVPQRLYVETLKYWFINADKHIQLATIEHEFLVQEPPRVLRVDPRVLQSPKHFQALLNILEFYLKAARSYQKAVKAKYLSKFTTDKALAKAHDEVSAMQFATSECQYSLSVQILLEISDGEINSCENIIEIRRLAMGFIQKIFLTAPNVIFTVHYQGYPIKYIPWMVELVPSIYVMVEHMEELVRHFDLHRRIFAVFLISHIVSTLAVPKHVHLAQMILLVVENQMALLEPHQQIIFFYNILPALEIMAKKLVFVRTQIIGYIQKGINISHARAAIYPSLTIAIKQPEHVIIAAAKESIERIQSSQNCN